MALEMGLQALKALYQLAKMIKEAKDNVILVNGKLQTVASIEEVINLQLESIGPALPEGILHHAKTRLVGLRRTARRMKLKYNPLIAVLDRLGGAASTIKSESARLSKGVLSASMALGTLSVMMRRHGDRQSAVAFNLLKTHLTKAGVVVEELSPDLVQDRESFASLVGSTTSSELLGQFQVYKNEIEELDRVESFLDNLEFLVEELKAQDSALKDEMDEDDSRNNEHKSGYQLIPSYSSKKKKEREAPDARPSIEAHRQKGAQILLSQLCGGGKVVDMEALSKALREGSSPERLKFFARQLGEYLDEVNKRDRVITRERLERFLLEDGHKNAGFNIALVCLSIIDALDSFSGLRGLMEETRHITRQVIRPLTVQALAFGLLFQSEAMREGVVDDPDEVAALQNEADEKSLASRMQLLKVFAVDYEESFDYNLAPDPSLLLSISIDAGQSKYGLGPSTRQRLELLIAILAVCNIEADKLAIEKVEKDLKSELNLITSLGSSSMNQKIGELHSEVLETAFDARRILSGEAAEFWVKSFGKSAHEVLWSRFRSAFISFCSAPTSDRDLKRLQFLLLDSRGIVTLDHFKALTSGAQGSITKTMKALSSHKTLPENLNFVLSGKETRPKTQEGGGGGGGGSPTLSPSQKRAVGVRLMQIDKKATASEA